ncbi:MAG TPA: peptidoglycan-binding domain-containing protein [Stellaceae bacterium]|jgi:peptidoglycan hydrolase-like protein with peptidoglycan-binding domain|nr:peptidoglycan-binding domain-containing protein [Stellaceae bacterium]
MRDAYRTAPIRLPAFRQGNAAPAIKKIQVMLNACDSSGLVVDGVFGARTHEAVLAYQKSAKLTADGVVGVRTLGSLVVAREGPSTSRPTSSSSPTGPSASPTWSSLNLTAGVARPANVHEWPLSDVVAEVLKLTGNHLPEAVHAEWDQMISPTSLAAITATILVALAAQATPLGPVVDVGLLAFGLLSAGVVAFEGLQQLGTFFVMVAHASTEQDLDTAAQHLAQAIVLLGAAAVMGLLLKRAAADGNESGTALSKSSVDSDPIALRSQPEAPLKVTPRRSPAAPPEIDSRPSAPPESGEFQAHGLKVDPDSLPVGRSLQADLKAGDPTASAAYIKGQARSLLRSGTAPPTMRAVSDPSEQFFKIVKSGSTPSDITKYWITKDELLSLKNSPDLATDKLGLPNASVGEHYDVFVVSPKPGLTPNVYQSVIARTTEGSISRAGGANQVLLPNRSAFTAPALVGSL